MSRLGPHVQMHSRAALDWAARAPIVKGIDNTAVLKAARSDAIKVFRHWFPEDRQNLTDPAPVVAEILGALGGYNDPNLYIELYNECHQTERDAILAYVDWTQKATDLLHARGYKVAGFSFGTGNPPDLAIWKEIQTRSFGGVDLIALHEYWGWEGFSTWNALRCTRVHEVLGGQHPPFVITECGRDVVEGGKGGWLADELTVGQYVGELVAYDRELALLPYVLGATVFTCAPQGKWTKFDMDGIAYLLLSEEDEVTPQPPIPTVGEGFKKVEELVAPWLEDEQWQGQNTKHETSMAIGANGYATWRRKTNETVAVTDDGQIWRDFGNLGDGQLKRIG